MIEPKHCDSLFPLEVATGGIIRSATMLVLDLFNEVDDRLVGREEVMLLLLLEVSDVGLEVAVRAVTMDRASHI